MPRSICSDAKLCWLRNWYHLQMLILGHCRWKALVYQDYYGNKPGRGVGGTGCVRLINIVPALSNPSLGEALAHRPASLLTIPDRPAKRINRMVPVIPAPHGRRKEAGKVSRSIASILPLGISERCRWRCLSWHTSGDRALR